jgi:agmatinase
MLCDKIGSAHHVQSGCFLSEGERMMSKNSDLFDSHSMFANAFSFLGVPLTRDLSKADVAVLGVPFDLGTTGRAGCRHGPLSIRNASANLRWEEKRWPWSFNAFEKLSVIDYGDVEFGAGDSELMVSAVVEHVAEIHRRGLKSLTFGGDHFVTLPLLRAACQTHGTLALVHFDAHTDTYSESEKYDHGCMFYHAPKEGLIDPSHSIQIGIRTEYNLEQHQFQVIDAPAANRLATEEIVSAIKQRVGDRPVYLTFDIDCLDPAFAPGTGTPVVGGISTDKATGILRGLQGLNIIGADVVEVAPSYDHAEITALAAATLGLEILYLMAAVED